MPKLCRNHDRDQPLVDGEDNPSAHLSLAELAHENPPSVSLNEASCLPRASASLLSGRSKVSAKTQPQPTFVKQSKLLRYFDSAPIDCILVFTLSKGIVVSSISQVQKPAKATPNAQTVINPAIAPRPNVAVEPSLPEAGCVYSTSACCIVAYEVNRTAEFAPCFMIWCQGGLRRAV